MSSSMSSSTSAAALVRPATPTDADAIGEVHVRSWQHAYAGQLPDDFLAGLSVANRRRGWQRRLDVLPRGCQVFVAVADGLVSGFTEVGPNRDEDADERTGELYAIYLRPDGQGRGLGRLLNDQGLAALAAAGYRAATLWVLDTNRHARGFYERMCWTADGAAKTETIADGTVSITEVRYRIGLSDDEVVGAAPAG